MLKVNTIQTNFTSGELSPWLLGRSDIERYQNGAELLENFYARHQGGIVGRLGTRNVGRTFNQNQNGKVRLQEFVYSRDDAAMLEFSEGKIRVFKNDELVITGEATQVGSDEMVQGNTYTIVSRGAHVTSFAGFTAFGGEVQCLRGGLLYTGWMNGLTITGNAIFYQMASWANSFYTNNLGIHVGSYVMVSNPGFMDWIEVGAAISHPLIGTVFQVTGGFSGPNNGVYNLLSNNTPVAASAINPASNTSYAIATDGGVYFTDYGASSDSLGTSFTATGPAPAGGVVEYSTLGPLSIVTPYTDDEIDELQFAQSADVLYITHPNHPQATLSRYGDTDWRFEYPQFDYGPYLDQGPGDQNTSLTVTGVTDRVRLTSSEADFAGASVDACVEYSYAGQKVLGQIKAVLSDYAVDVEPLEDRSLVLSREVYSPGLYTGWDGTNSVPIYDSTIEGSDVSVAFSAVGVVTQEHIGNFLRFTDRDGTYYWMYVEGVTDILRQGAYGIIAIGDILTVMKPTGIITRGDRRINARLRSSDPTFFNLTTDKGRLFRLVLGDTVVHARGRSEATYQLVGNTVTGEYIVYLSREDAEKVLPGDSIVGDGIPGGTVIVATFPNEEQSYCTISNAVTDDGEGVAFTINEGTEQELGVTLNRALPRSIEGLTAVQNGTTNDWNRGAWYIGNYPSTVTFHQGRLVFAGTYHQPQTVWMSKVDDLYNFATTDEKLKVLDDSAINITLASDTVNQIQWCISRQILLIGTVGAEWKVTSSNQGSPITPTTVSAEVQSSYGSAFAKPIPMGKSVLYLQRGGQKLREMSYDYQTDSQVSLDLTVFAEHIFKDHGGAKQACYQPLPESVLYVRLGNGQIAVLAYEPDQKVYAWSRFVIGGPSAIAEAIACMPYGDTFKIYLIVRRTVNGGYVRTIEVMMPEFRPISATDRTNLYFLDNYRTGGAGSSSLTGLNDYAGCAVAALVDDQVHTGLTVAANGTLTLPSVPSARYAVGFPFTTKLKTFPLEAPAAAGTGQGKVKRIDHITLRLLNTINFKHGRSLSALTEENFRAASDPVGAVPPMFSGDRRVPFENGYDTRASLFIVQDKPLPIAILALMPETAQYA